MTKGKSDGVPLIFTLFLALTTLKVAGYITWSWWWITAPLWFVPALGILFLLVGCLIVVLKGPKK